MKINAQLVRRLRSNNHWSQEHLAEVCGLGLRTIQRVEANGTASLETIKSLAVVFGVDTDSLTKPNQSFEGYKHKQWGWVTLAVMPTLGICVMLFSRFLFTLPLLIEALLITAFTIVLLIFSSMTVEVSNNTISWYYGPSLIKKRLDLTEVQDSRKVKNPWWMGFGIHGYSTGWIYNVSGMLGVEIELKGGSFIRLGSDEPNYLLDAIRVAKATPSGH